VQRDLAQRLAGILKLVQDKVLTHNVDVMLQLSKFNDAGAHASIGGCPSRMLRIAHTL
jgi:hypothetical protein